MSASHALDALLDGLVDYAGLFPPAGLSMEEAVTHFARYRAGTDRRMLGRFVVPVARLGELAYAVEGLGVAAPSVGSPWRLSVLASAGEGDVIAGFAAAHGDAHAAAPGAAHGDALVIDTIEAKADDVATVDAIAAAFSSTQVVYVEVPVSSDPAALVAAIGARGLRAKVRTGGVTADAFPVPAELVRFLTACLEAHVPFKATAGLHHSLRGAYPLTYAPDSAKGTMYGFLNVFLAAVLLREGASATNLTALLEERDPVAIVAELDALCWRGFRATTAQIAAARASFATSFGSCSFEQPVRELTTLQLR